MDTITHAISGAVIGIATTRRPEEMRRRAFWGAMFAAFPDADALMIPFVDHFTYLNEHRGLTHSVVMLPLWSALLGWLAARAGKLPFREMAALAAAALAAHILGDLITSYGTRIFTPIYDAPFAFPIVFIIDPLFTLLLAGGLALALLKGRVQPAAWGGALLAIYLVMQTVLHLHVAGIGRAQAEAIGMPDAPVVVLPQPLSPFNWSVTVVTPEGYRRAHLNLLASGVQEAPEGASLLARLRTHYRPSDALEWRRLPRWPSDAAARAVAEEAWMQPGFAGFRRFALLPYVTAMRGSDNGVCVWFADYRFTLPDWREPFEYAICGVPGGEWQLELGRERA